MKPIAYTPAGDANGVFVCIPEADASVYVEQGFTTDDPLVVAALDENPAVVRAETGNTNETSKASPADEKGA